jgi:hypothetical protein
MAAAMQSRWRIGPDPADILAKSLVSRAFIGGKQRRVATLLCGLKA